ncbi:hypothetical protein [Dictyobacter aurantiacus]|uniref:Uncharacterized protein n=1 Tax=Dictyobacter aurantiacus TaxID=1936993 RepID=A0A401ZT02_9CHLR|nr:hypothetical protein [Dictyobacter aurantiacus]GCE09916.1 hypothetical protein KDAU_72450 [Dictyobacter aurantiacus]
MQVYYEQLIKQTQTIKTSTLGTLKFTVDSAYLNGNRAIVKYSYIPLSKAEARTFQQVTDYPQLSAVHELKFPGLSGDQPTPMGNETIMTFGTALCGKRRCS